jgi:hypothetical protein
LDKAPGFIPGVGFSLPDVLPVLFVVALVPGSVFLAPAISAEPLPLTFLLVAPGKILIFQNSSTLWTAGHIKPYLSFATQLLYLK